VVGERESVRGGWVLRWRWIVWGFCWVNTFIKTAANPVMGRK
jgi:hypothetical protein